MTVPTDSSAGLQKLPRDFGRYRLDRVLGRGAMGTVYLAHDQHLNRPVALKMPKFHEDSPPNWIERFYREARSAAVLNHPNLCPVYDVGEIAGEHFITMGYVEGRTLADYIRSGVTRSEQEITRLVWKIATGMQEAHERGIIHRDLKPANIMINRRDEPVVMDFGLSRQTTEEESRLTQEGMMVGTPAYMAPELLTGQHQASAASDIYSLGVILYELLTGRTPFTGSVMNVITQVLQSEPKPLEELRPGVSANLVSVCRRAMAKNPQHRFGSMKEVAEALSGVRRDHPSWEAMELPQTVAVAHANVQTAQDLTPTQIASSHPELAQRKPWTIIVISSLSGVALVALIVVILPLLDPNHKKQPAEEPVSATAEIQSWVPELPPQNAAPREQFARLDRNNDERLDPTEFALHIIHRGDLDQDDQLSFEEYARAHRERGAEFFAPPTREGYGPLQQPPLRREPPRR